MKRIAVLTMVLGAVAAAPVSGQVAWGPQLSFADDADFGVGLRVEAPLSQLMTLEPGSEASTMFLIGSFDWFFPDDGDVDGVDVRYFEINANVGYPLDVEGFDPYVGGGLNIANGGVSFDDPAFEDTSDTEVGLNLLGGLKFPVGGMNAFAEARIELSGGEQFVISAGLLF